MQVRAANIRGCGFPCPSRNYLEYTDRRFQGWRAVAPSGKQQGRLPIQELCCWTNSNALQVLYGQAASPIPYLAYVVYHGTESTNLSNFDFKFNNGILET